MLIGSVPNHNARPARYIGTAIEQYDFLLYGTAAALVFNKLFFPNIDPLLGTIAAFGTFAVGFFGRPLGGIIGGHFGDRIGRKVLLMTTLVVMGLVTVLVGLLPTYDSIGIAAPIVLTILRFIQGLALGGEQGGAILIAVENAPEGKRGLFGSLPQAGGVCGVLLSTGAVSLASTLPEADFLAWGWRVPFIASLLLVILGVFVRARLYETLAFQQAASETGRARVPLATLLHTQLKDVAIVFGARVGEISWVFIILAFTVAYATGTLHLPRTLILNAMVAASALNLLTLPLFGMLSDKVGRRPVYAFGAACVAVYAWPYFLLIDTRDPTLITLAVVAGYGVFWPMMYGPQASFFSELFATRVRYSGLGFGQGLGATIGGGLTPAIASTLLGLGGDRPWLVAAFSSTLAVIALLCVACARETRRLGLES